MSLGWDRCFNKVDWALTKLVARIRPRTIRQSLGIQSYLLRLGDWRHSYVGFEGPSTFWEGTTFSLGNWKVAWICLIDHRINWMLQCRAKSQMHVLNVGSWLGPLAHVSRMFRASRSFKCLHIYLYPRSHQVFLCMASLYMSRQAQRVQKRPEIGWLFTGPVCCPECSAWRQTFAHIKQFRVARQLLGS